MINENQDFLRCPSCHSLNIHYESHSDTWLCLNLACLWEGEDPDLQQDGDFLDGSNEIPELERHDG